jgi:hypothetical protein
MKKQIIRIVILLLTIVMVLSLAACGNSKKSGSGSLSPSDDNGLIYGTRYYYNGDPNDFGYTFYADGTILDSDDDEGRFEFDGSIYRVYYGDDLNGEFRLIDTYTIKEIDYGTVYICEGGDGYKSGSVDDDPVDNIVNNNGLNVPWMSLDLSPDCKYYMHGNPDAGYIMFSDNWTLEMSIMYGGGYIFAGNSSGKFTANDDTLLCTFDFFYEDMEIEILDEYALRWRVVDNPVLINADFYFIREGRTGADYGIDDEGESINGGASGSGSAERGEALQYFVRYYLNGDENRGYLYFWDDGEVNIYQDNGDRVDGSFSVADDTITIQAQGEIIELIIIDGYTLDFPPEGSRFICVD